MGLKKGLFQHAIPRVQPGALAAGLSTDAGLAKHDKGMTALTKTRRWAEIAYAAAMTPLS
jgi:hypothetical protein